MFSRLKTAHGNALLVFGEVYWVKQKVELFHEAKLLKKEEYAFFKKYAEMPDYDEQGRSTVMPPEYWEQGAKIVTCMMQEKRYKNYF